MTSITQDLQIIKSLAEEIQTGKPRKLRESRCEHCNGRVFFERGFNGSDDEPASQDFTYCEDCGHTETFDADQ